MIGLLIKILNSFDHKMSHKNLTNKAESLAAYKIK